MNCHIFLVIIICVILSEIYRTTELDRVTMHATWLCLLRIMLSSQLLPTTCASILSAKLARELMARLAHASSLAKIDILDARLIHCNKVIRPQRRRYLRIVYCRTQRQDPQARIDASLSSNRNKSYSSPADPWSGYLFRQKHSFSTSHLVSHFAFR